MEYSREINQKYLTFWIGERVYALTVADIIQIVQMDDITPVPGFPAYMKGVVHFRKKVIPVVDIARLFANSSFVGAGEQHMIVTVIHGHETGLLVDRVNEICDFDLEEVANPMAMDFVEDNYFSGIVSHHETLIPILKKEKLVSAKELSDISSMVDSEDEE